MAGVEVTYGVPMAHGSAVAGSRRGLVAACAATIAVLAVGTRPSAAAPEVPITLTNRNGALVVAGAGCGPNEPGMVPGPVQVDVTTWFEGKHEPSEPKVIGSATLTPQEGGTWEYPVRQPLGVVPSWATTSVVRATASCNWAISTGYDYEPVELHRTIGRPAAPSTPTVATPASSGTATAPAATPLPETAHFTG